MGWWAYTRLSIAMRLVWLADWIYPNIVGTIVELDKRATADEMADEANRIANKGVDAPGRNKNGEDDMK